MSKGSSQPTITPTSTLTGGQRKFLNALMKYAEPQIGEGVQTYSGELTPGAQPLQKGAWDMVSQLMSGSAPGQKQSTDFTQSLIKPWDPGFATGEWKKAIQDPTMQNWNDQLLPSVLEKYAGSDAAGGGMAAKTVTDEAMKLQTGLESNLASTLLQDKNQSNTQGLMANEDLWGQFQQILSGASGGGAEQYNVGQAADTAAQKNWLTGQPYENPWLDIGTGGLNTTAIQNVVTPGQQSLMPSLIGAAGSVLGSSGVSSVIGKGLTSLAGGIGSMCCFIFIESHGDLHPIVRRYRDEHMTEQNRRGYYRIADKLVPLMQKHKIIRNAVKFLMVDPMTSYGKWFYGEGKIGKIFKPITKFWLKVFDKLGSDGKYTRSNGEVI